MVEFFVVGVGQGRIADNESGKIVNDIAEKDSKENGRPYETASCRHGPGLGDWNEREDVDRGDASDKPAAPLVRPDHALLENTDGRVMRFAADHICPGSKVL